LQGLHADKIAEKSHIDGGKLGAYMNYAPQSAIRQSKARTMRHLASHHVYREVGPDTFAKNRLSATLDTKKPVAEVFSEYVAMLLGKDFGLNFFSCAPKPR
jgi:hypothetical protein